MFSPMLRPLLAASALSCALASSVSALDLSAMTDSEKTAFGQAVHDYLMSNPDVLLDVAKELDQRQQADAEANDKALVQANADALFHDPDDWVAGNPDGDVSIVEFTDYKCGYCKKAYPDIGRLLQSDGKIRLVVKELPILGPQSELSSRFAVAVKQLYGDAAYSKLHDTLMKQQDDITPDGLNQLAQDQGLDPKAIDARMGGPEVTAALQQNFQLAQRLNIQGTPAFVIGDQLLRGYAPLPAMKQMIAAQRN